MDRLEEDGTPGGGEAMVRLAMRQLRSDRIHATLTCVGIASVFATILVLQGFREGLYHQLRRVALDRGADLIVAQAGVANLVGARSSLPQMVRAQVEAVEGVATAHPMTAIPLIFDERGRKSAIFLMVVDSVGGPPTVTRGRRIEASGEILIDRSLAEIHDLEPGDPFTLAGFDFRIAGITTSTAALWTPFAFTDYDSLLDFYFDSNLADDLSAFPLLSNLLVRLDPGADAEEVRGAIEAASPDLDVHFPAAVARNDAQMGRSMFGSILAVLIGIAYVGGLLVIALFMFTIAQARRSDLGIMKALGFGDGRVLASVLAETAILILLALPLGGAIAAGVASVVRRLVPLYEILPLEPVPVLLAVGGCAASALVGSFVPYRFVRGLDPAEVFRS